MQFPLNSEFETSLKLVTSMKMIGNCKKEFETWKLPRIRIFCCLELDVPAQPAILAPKILEFETSPVQNSTGRKDIPETPLHSTT